MKRFFYFIITTVFLCTALLPINAKAETKAELYLGEKEMCLETVRIKETRILDNQTILFEMRGGNYYLNRLPVVCPGLKIAGGFSYSTSIAKLCKQDSIKLISRGSEPTSTTLLGEFVQFKGEGTIDKVERLLTDGLLKELVAEGAFQEAFSQKN
ncbi:MAG: hypothetical protein JW944_10525 [Deltaproteobacteria bacterium]|nr:hypothetical protein [Deltaproteobacteria bacterium]